MTVDLNDLARSIVDRADSGEHVEAYVARGRETDVRVFDGEVESLASATSAGVGVRVLVDGPDGTREGFAWAGTLEPSVVAETLAAARDNARFATPDPHLALAAPDGVAAADLVTFDPRGLEVSTEAKIAFATEVERLVRAYPKIKGTRASDYGDAEVEAALASTNGIAVESRRSTASASVQVIAADGDEVQTGYGLTAGRSFFDLDLQATADDAITRAVAMLGATKPTSRHCPVVLDPRVVAQLLAIISAALSGEAVVKGRSFFAGRLGESVAARGVTVVDDPTNPLAFGASRYDGEGLACRRNELIVDGELRSFYYDTVAGRRAGVASTGSAVRGGFAGTPGPGCRALSLAPGSMDRDATLASVGSGVFVSSISGVHSGVSPVSGDFSVGVEGFLIEHGTLGAPIREATVASTLQKMLADVVAVGNDVEWLPGSAAGQSVALAEMALSGN